MGYTERKRLVQGDQNLRAKQRHEHLSNIQPLPTMLTWTSCCLY